MHQPESRPLTPDVYSHDVRAADRMAEPRVWGWPTYVSLAATLGILLGLVSLLDVRDVWRQVAASNKMFLLLGGLAHYATYGVRGMRWRRCLARWPVAAGSGRFGLLVFFYNAVDNVVPAKLADVYAAHLAWINCGVRRSVALGSLVFMRMLDAWIVLAFAALSSWVLFAAHMPRAVLWSLGIGAFAALGSTCIILGCVLWRKALPNWLPSVIQERLQAFNTGIWPYRGDWLPIALLTFLIWTLETLWMVSLIRAFGIHLVPLQGMFLTAIPLLASAFPLTPSGTGVVEVTLFSCLCLLGVAAPTAASVTVVNRLIDHWLHIGLGAVTWAFRHAIGLRTWREESLDPSFGAAPSPKLSVT